MFKAYMVFESNYSADQLMTIICNLPTRSKWDPIYIRSEVIEKRGSNSDVLYTVLKTPKGVTYRDYVQQRLVRKIKLDDYLSSGGKLPFASKPLSPNSHAYVVISRSCAHQNFPPNPPKGTFIELARETDAGRLLFFFSASERQAE